VETGVEGECERREGCVSSLMLSGSGMLEVGRSGWAWESEGEIGGLYFCFWSVFRLTALIGYNSREIVYSDLRW